MSSASVPSQVNIIRSICSEKLNDEVLRKKVLKSCDQIMKLSNFRNEIAHGFWWDHIWPENDTRTIALQKKGGDKLVSMEMFYDKAGEVKSLRDETWSLLSQLPRKCQITAT